METFDTIQGNQRQADVVELARFSGFFAGEGSISISGPQNHKNALNLWVMIGNTEREWVKAFKQVFGGSIYIEFPKRFKNAKPVYRWRLYNSDAANFLRAIFPFLIGEKRAQVEIALRFQAIKDQRDSQRYNRRQPFSLEQLEQMERLKDELKELRRAVAETKRRDASPVRNDSPIPQEIVAQ